MHLPEADKNEGKEVFIMSTLDAFEELNEEGGAEGVRRSLLAALRVRGIAVPDDARERIMAERDVERLERWLERAVIAVSIAEVLDEPS
jgi:hypothetical protein